MGGITLAWLSRAAPLPSLKPALHLPTPVWPTGQQVVRGTDLAVLPRVPVTLTNAIIVTAAVARQLFPQAAGRVTERNLAISHGLGNLLATPLGGYLIYHGAGGVTNRDRFGARTASAPVIIGVGFIAPGLLLGASALPLMQVIAATVLGGRSPLSGLELALSARPPQYAKAELFVLLLSATVGVATNAAVAFALGLPLAYARMRGAVRLA